MYEWTNSVIIGRQQIVEILFIYVFTFMQDHDSSNNRIEKAFEHEIILKRNAPGLTSQIGFFFSAGWYDISISLAHRNLKR